MVILVTGGNGLLGSEFQRLLSENSNVECHSSENGDIKMYYDNEKRIDWVFYSHSAWDITDRTRCRNLICYMFNPAYVINCAAYTNVDACEGSGFYSSAKINRDALDNLASACHDNGTVLIHFSTDYVYEGNTDQKPLGEDDKKLPLSNYAMHKFQGETIIENSGCDYYIIRTSWLYGKNGKCFPLTVCDKIGNGEEMTVVNDQFGTPTYGLDLAKFVMEIISHGCDDLGNGNRKNVYNFSNEGETNWFEYARKIATIKFGKRKAKLIKPCTTEEYVKNAKKAVAKRPKYSVLSKDKAMEKYGFYIPKWEESLEKFLKEM